MYHSGGESPRLYAKTLVYLVILRQKCIMQNYRKTSHSTYDCKYHIVWIAKYRKRVLVGVIAERIHEIISGICKEYEVDIINGHISQDHVHLFVSVPPIIDKQVITISER